MEMSISEAAMKVGRTRQSIHFSVKTGKLSAKRKNGRWVITTKQLEDYQNKAYIFDKTQGLYSFKEAAKILGCSVNYIYQMTYLGKINSFRKGFSWVIHIDDILDYKNKMNKRNNGL